MCLHVDVNVIYSAEGALSPLKSPPIRSLSLGLFLFSLLLSGLVAPMSIDHGSKVTPIKAGPMAELAAMREQYANSGGVPPPPGAPTLPGRRTVLCACSAELWPHLRRALGCPSTRLSV